MPWRTLLGSILMWPGLQICVYYLLSTVYCLLFIIYCLLSTRVIEKSHLLFSNISTMYYAYIILAPAESFGLWPRLFVPFGQKKGLIMLCLPI